LLDDKAMLVDGAVDDETVGRRLVRQAPRAASLALSGAPSGRHQRSANAHDDSRGQKAKFGPDPTMEALHITGGVTKIGNCWQ
jgi:hypothetical protein